MSNDKLKGQWEQFKGSVQERWGELTNDDVDQVKGEQKQLVGKIRERYGIAKEEAEEQVSEWLNNQKS